MTACTADSDETLIGAFRTGDASAMEALFRRYRRQVYGWLVRMLADEAEAEDVYQDVWLRIVRNVGDFRNDGSFKCWLWRIVHNCTTDRLRRRLPTLTLDEPACDDGEADTVLDRIADDSTIGVLERMDIEERRMLLRNAVSELSLPLRTVVLLRIDGELEFNAIAGLLKIPLGTVLARMHRAVGQLRKALSAKGEVGT